MTDLLFRKAHADEAQQIAALINAAYRGNSSRLGWTSEADLLEGGRTDAEEIKRLIASEADMLLLGFSDDVLVASVCLQKIGKHAHLGMFVVEPVRQNHGIGKQLLAAAEQTVGQQWAVDKISMAVITCRHELIAFYERRGYMRTGKLQQFPLNPGLWTPKVQGLQLEILEKPLLTLSEALP